MALGTLALRTTIGAFFVGHGAQKLFGAFGGHGLDGTAGFFESLGLRPGKRHATSAGVTEAAGGALLLTGVATPLAATALSATMITAVRKVHLQNGPWVSNGGYEYNVVLVAALAALAEQEGGPKAAALTLAGGALGSWLATGPLNDSSPAPTGAGQDLPGDPATTDGQVGQPAAATP